MDVDWLLGHLLAWTIGVAAVLTALWYAWYRMYLFAGGFTLLLVAYAYLARYGDEPIEKRLI